MSPGRASSRRARDGASPSSRARSIGDGAGERALDRRGAASPIVSTSARVARDRAARAPRSRRACRGRPGSGSRCRRREALERLQRRVHVGALRVVDPAHAAAPRRRAGSGAAGPRSASARSTIAVRRRRRGSRPRRARRARSRGCARRAARAAPAASTARPRSRDVARRARRPRARRRPRPRPAAPRERARAAPRVRDRARAPRSSAFTTAKSAGLLAREDARLGRARSRSKPAYRSRWSGVTLVSTATCGAEAVDRLELEGRQLADEVARRRAPRGSPRAARRCCPRARPAGPARRRIVGDPGRRRRLAVGPGDGDPAVLARRLGLGDAPGDLDLREDRDPAPARRARRPARRAARRARPRASRLRPRNARRRPAEEELARRGPRSALEPGERRSRAGRRRPTRRRRASSSASASARPLRAKPSDGDPPRAATRAQVGGRSSAARSSQLQRREPERPRRGSRGSRSG